MGQTSGVDICEVGDFPADTGVFSTESSEGVFSLLVFSSSSSNSTYGKSSFSDISLIALTTSFQFAPLCSNPIPVVVQNTKSGRNSHFTAILPASSHVMPRTAPPATTFTLPASSGITKTHTTPLLRISLCKCPSTLQKRVETSKFPVSFANTDAIFA
jgi:hypothetical protein